MIERMVIVGGGQAGGWAAKTLREQGFTGEICVVADEPWDFYERPPLSKGALLEAAPALPRLFSPESVAALGITWYRPQRAEAIIAGEKTLILSSGQRLAYDKLLLATGGRARLPGSDWQRHPAVYTLRTWEDARRLKEQLACSQRLAVVGGGWIGLEIAASARKQGLEVTVFESQPLLCQRSVNPAVSRALLEIHQQNGVTVHCQAGALSLDDDQGKPVIISGQQRTVFDAVVVGIGVELNLELARQAGLEIDCGIVVDSFGRTSNGDIFAAGDVARHPTLGIAVQSWSFAQNQSVVAARAMLGDLSRGYDDAPWLWSDQYHHNIQILGIPDPDGTTLVRKTDGSALYFTLTPQGRLSQLVAFNDPRTVKLARRWMATGRDLSGVPLTDPEFSLMTLR